MAARAGWRPGGETEGRLHCAGMKVATRITVATAVVVAIASSAYALFDLRERTTERRMEIEREARAIANTLRMALETQASAFRIPSDAQLRELGRDSGGWRITVIPRELATALPSATMTAVQLRRLRTLIGVPGLTFAELEGEQYFYALALRAQSAQESERVVLGMLEIAKPASTIQTTPGDLSRALILVVLVVLVTTIVVGSLAGRFVSRPITKLLRGIDDVAKGDLSHVILSEHDDEIGAIATRFNEMTYSLRESRARAADEGCLKPSPQIRMERWSR